MLLKKELAKIKVVKSFNQKIITVFILRSKLILNNLFKFIGNNLN